MTYDVFEKAYSTLTEDQQSIVYELVVALMNVNKNADCRLQKRRVFGKFSKIGSVVFSDKWEISEEELLGL